MHKEQTSLRLEKVSKPFYAWRLTLLQQIQRYDQIIQKKKDERNNSPDLKQKIDLILGKKKVNTKRDYMEIYGIGMVLEKGISQSNQSRYDLRQASKKKAPLGNKLAPINILDAKNKRG